MSYAITVDRAGRLVLPADVRRRLNLGPGSKMLLDVVAQRIELTPQADGVQAAPAAPGRRLVLSATAQTTDAARATRLELDAQADGKG